MTLWPRTLLARLLIIVLLGLLLANALRAYGYAGQS